jgi:hypothetical protein
VGVLSHAFSFITSLCYPALLYSISYNKVE